jgi:hypothetical protein
MDHDDPCARIGKARRSLRFPEQTGCRCHRAFCVAAQKALFFSAPLPPGTPIRPLNIPPILIIIFKNKIQERRFSGQEKSEWGNRENFQNILQEGYEAGLMWAIGSLIE